MNRTSPRQTLTGWRALYVAALFEADKNRIPARIADAQKAITARSRELFSAESDKAAAAEDQALENALRALRALQSCLDFRVAA